MTPQRHPFVRRRAVPEGYVLIFHNKAFFLENDLDRLWLSICGTKTVREIAARYSSDLAIDLEVALPKVMASALQFEKLGLVRFRDQSVC